MIPEHYINFLKGINEHRWDDALHFLIKLIDSVKYETEKELFPLVRFFFKKMNRIDCLIDYQNKVYQLFRFKLDATTGSPGEKVDKLLTDSYMLHLFPFSVTLYEDQIANNLTSETYQIMEYRLQNIQLQKNLFFLSDFYDQFESKDFHRLLWILDCSFFYLSKKVFRQVLRLWIAIQNSNWVLDEFRPSEVDKDLNLHHLAWLKTLDRKQRDILKGRLHILISSLLDDETIYYQVNNKDFDLIDAFYDFFFSHSVWNTYHFLSFTVPHLLKEPSLEDRICSYVQNPELPRYLYLKSIAELSVGFSSGIFEEVLYEKIAHSSKRFLEFYQNIFAVQYNFDTVRFISAVRNTPMENIAYDAYILRLLYLTEAFCKLYINDKAEKVFSAVSQKLISFQEMYPERYSKLIQKVKKINQYINTWRLMNNPLENFMGELLREQKIVLKEDIEIQRDAHRRFIRMLPFSQRGILYLKQNWYRLKRKVKKRIDDKKKSI
jgi:hypothetical protein